MANGTGSHIFWPHNLRYLYGKSPTNKVKKKKSNKRTVMYNYYPVCIAHHHCPGCVMSGILVRYKNNMRSYCKLSPSRTILKNIKIILCTQHWIGNVKAPATSTYTNTFVFARQIVIISRAYTNIIVHSSTPTFFSHIYFVNLFSVLLLRLELFHCNLRYII